MVMVRKPGNTGWAPQQPPMTPRPPAAPPSKQGGVNGPGVRVQPQDPKHPAHEVYRWGQPAAGAKQVPERPYVQHQDRRVDAGRRMGPAKGRGK
jgi:hypothetical protein